MMKQLPSFENAQRAIRGGKDPRAFLHLGILYTQGIGVIKNHILAHYFLKKALDMGCKEAEEYLELGYESGEKDFGDEINTIIGDSDDISREMIAKLKVRIEKERKAGNFGNLAKIRKHLHVFYPEYDREKAISDILNNRHTVDADILFTLSTGDNRSEVYIESQDKLLQQLYAPVTSNKQLYDAIIKADNIYLLGQDEKELAQCIVNLNSSYKTICKEFRIKRQNMFSLDSLELYPYIKISDLVLLRRQGFRALLSIKDVDPVIQDKFLKCLDSDEKLLNVCEEVRDLDIQLFLMSFVEMNIDVETLELASHTLLHAFRNDNLMPLADHLNAFVDRLTAAGIKHDFPRFTTENLPPIQLSN